jgi:hypothetical protein
MPNMRSTFQVALACALGALACSVIAVVTGNHIAFGIIAGLITGYAAYEFRSVLRAVPRSYDAFLSALISPSLRAELRQRDPFEGPTTLVVLSMVIYIMWPALFPHTHLDSGREQGLILVAVFLSLLLTTLGAWVATFVVMVFAECGARRWENVSFIDSEYYQLTLPNGDAVTYAMAWRWTAKGIASVGALILFRFLPWFAVAIGTGGWTLFKLIHSSERVLCAIDGTLGGAIAYQFLIRQERTITQNAIAVLFGMVLGVGWGLVNYEIVSKRVLKVVPVIVSGGAQ